MNAQAKSGGGGGGRPTRPGAGSGGGGKRKPPAAGSPPRDRVTEKVDGAATEHETVEVAKSSGDGSVTTDEPDLPVSENTKDGQKVTTTRDDTPGDPMATRIRPAAEPQPGRDNGLPTAPHGAGR